MSFAEDYLIEREYPQFTNDKQKLLIEHFKNFSDALCDRNENDASNFLFLIFADFSRQHHIPNESFYKSHMANALAFARGKLTAESSKLKGEPDFTIEMRNQVLVIEVKYRKLPSVYQTGAGEAHPDYSKDGDAGNSADFLDVDPSKDTSANDEVMPERKSISSKTVAKKKKEQIQMLLDSAIAEALRQIDSRGYAKSYLGGSSSVWKVAVAIVDRDTVKIKFLKATYENKG